MTSDWHSQPARTGIGVLSVLLTLCVLFASAQAQQLDVRPYETEEDLWEALSEEEIDFEEFLDLLDLARSGGDSLIVPPSDWEALPGSDAGYLATPDSNATIIRRDGPPADRRMNFPYMRLVRSGVDADLSQPTGSDGYSVVRWQSGQVRGVADWEHDRDTGGRWRRRTFVWNAEFVTAQLGSVEPRWGRGLVVGRRSRAITSGDVSGSFWQPTRGRFNGVWAATNSQRRLSFQGLYSNVHGDSLVESFGAFRAESRLGPQEVGLSLSSGAYRRDGEVRWTNDRRAIGADVHLRSGKREVLAEFAIQNQGASAKAVELLWPLAHGRFHARAWSYGREYTNPWGGGPGHRDTREVAIENTDRTFRSRTAGERGFDFSTRIAVASDVNLRWDWMSHRETPGAILEHSGVFRAEFKRRLWRLTPFLRGRIDEDKTESFSIGNYAWLGPKHRELNLRCEVGRHNSAETQFVRAGLGVNVQIHHSVMLAPAIRWVDPNLDRPGDAYWYLYFRERLVPMPGAKLEIALVWKKFEQSAKADPVELRVRLLVH